MERDITERQSKIIRAVVGEYIFGGQPVGSNIIVDKYGLDISSATVRKEMSLLEQVGFLTSPHTSAGRVPTDNAVQYYIETLINLYEITLSEKNKLEAFYQQAKWQLDQLLQKTAHLLALTSDSVGVVLAPVSTGSVIKRIELISVLDNLTLAIIVSQSGAIFQKKIKTDEAVSQESLYKISRYLNQRLKGYEIADLQDKGLSFLVDSADLGQDLINIAVKFVQSFVYNPPDQQLYIDGEGSLYQNLLEVVSDQKSAKALMDKLLDENFIRNVLNHMRDTSKVTSSVGVHIGGEYISGIALLTKGYSVGGRDMGALGVMGTNRIPYEKLIPTIEYSSILLSDVLSEQYERKHGQDDDPPGKVDSTKLIDQNLEGAF